jgi:hypothetical protein
MAIIFKRVSYGKKDWPMDQREYRCNGQGPVGCISEIVEHVMKPQNIQKVLLKDLDGNYILHINGEVEKTT